ncbi:MAG: hypothetical protein KC656_33930, partial [Myxococcales bacterium]|nr:hypothetical protein [Myxococcales bacterium]
MTTESSPEALAERAFHVDGVLTRVRLRNLPPPEVLADPAWATVRDIELVESPRLIDAWKDCAWFLGLRSALGLGRSGVEQAAMLGARFSGISMLPNPTFIG